MRDDDLDLEDRALVATLRELPPEGTEPDWAELEAAIRAEVGEAAPRPWWRNWRWIVPVWALATTAAVALVVMRGDEPAVAADPTAIAPLPRDAAVAPEPAPPAPEVGAVWLDGDMVMLDGVTGAALDELDGEARAALAPEGDVTGGILPIADYGWIDSLDAEALERADEWLKRNKS